MELRQLRYFVTVAHKRHFTQAAEELYIAQPALSQQIQALEHELGVTLFERTSRSVRLTPAGEALLVRAEQMLLETEQMQQEMQAFAGLSRGRVTIGVLQSLSAYRLSALLARFHAYYPGIDIVLREDVTEQLLEHLKMGQLDITFTHYIENVFPKAIFDTQIETVSVLTEEVILVAAPDHPLSSRQSLSAKELQHEAFLIFKPGSGLRQMMLYISNIGDFTPKILFESGDIGTLRALAAAGLGISVLPRSVVDAPGQKVVPLTLDPPLPLRTVVMAWHKRIVHTPAANAFLHFLLEDLHLHPWQESTS